MPGSHRGVEAEGCAAVGEGCSLHKASQTQSLPFCPQKLNEGASAGRERAFFLFFFFFFFLSKIGFHLKDARASRLVSLLYRFPKDKAEKLISVTKVDRQAALLSPEDC